MIEKNKRGDFIQIMIISSAGAEGISLKCVRQVHILEPFWNYVRIDQVLGRAVRDENLHDIFQKHMKMLNNIYIYTLPQGFNLEEVYKSLKNDPNNKMEYTLFDDDKIISELSKIDNKKLKTCSI